MTTSPLKTKLSNFMTDVWNKGDFSKLSDYITNEYVVKHDPGDKWEGKTLDYESFKERVSYSRNAFPDLTFDIQEFLEEDGKIAITWLMSGTHLGALDGLPPTHKHFSISGMTIYSFENGKISGHQQAYDRLGFLAQIGVLRLG